MKRSLFLLLSVLTVLSICSCGNLDSEETSQTVSSSSASSSENFEAESNYSDSTRSTTTSHTHNYLDADCTSPKMCECGKTSGESLGHSWQVATCTTAKVCSRCGKTDGESLGHSWESATCISPKMCSLCKTTEGEPLGHDWEEATLNQPKTCIICNDTIGSALDYTYVGIGWVDTQSDNLNLRESPTTNAEVITTIPKGSSITVYDCGDLQWYYTEYNGKPGYVSSLYVSFGDAEQNSNDDILDDNTLPAKDIYELCEDLTQYFREQGVYDIYFEVNTTEDGTEYLTVSQYFDNKLDGIAVEFQMLSDYNNLIDLVGYDSGVYERAKETQQLHCEQESIYNNLCLETVRLANDFGVHCNVFYYIYDTDGTVVYISANGEEAWDYLDALMEYYNYVYP